MIFLNGPDNPIVGFTGGLVGGDGPILFADTIYLTDGKAMPLNPDANAPQCHFYFTDHGTFTQGWENRLTTIECNAKVKGADGHLASVDVRFDAIQTPGSATVDTGSLPSPKAAPDAPASSPRTLLASSGSGSKSTQIVTVPSEWSLEWSYDCSNFGPQGNFQVFVYNSNGSPAEANGLNQLGAGGADTEYYHQGGNLYFVIRSECRWTIKVLR